MTKRHEEKAMPDVKPWEVYNIMPEVGGFAASFFQLEPLATGGGVDYILRTFGEVQAVVAGSDGFGAPDELAEPSSVVFHMTGDDWNGPSFEVQFAEAREAIRWLGMVKGVSYGKGEA